MFSYGFLDYEDMQKKKHEAAEKFTILHLTLYGELWLEVVRRLLVRAF